METHTNRNLPLYLICRTIKTGCRELPRRLDSGAICWPYRKLNPFARTTDTRRCVYDLHSGIKDNHLTYSTLGSTRGLELRQLRQVALQYSEGLWVMVQLEMLVFLKGTISR